MNGRGTNSWTVTGLRWLDGVPALTASDGRREHARALGGGARIGWELSGPRRCIGVRSAGPHALCPHRALVDPGGTGAQCPACQSADPGLALARDRIVDDGRSYRLYLAWFGDGLLKVGLTAEQRGIGRLVEQAALAFTFVARGRLPAVRRAELTVAQTGLARERVPAGLKHDGWWTPLAPEQRHRQLDTLRAEVLRLLVGHGIEPLPDDPVVDQVGLFGLAAGAPAAYQEITTLAAGATLHGTLRPAIGGHLFLEPDAAEPLLLDTRLLTGWALRAADVRECVGLTLRPRARPPETGDQGALF